MSTSLTQRATGQGEGGVGDAGLELDVEKGMVGGSPARVRQEECEQCCQQKKDAARGFKLGEADERLYKALHGPGLGS